jgi:hypothetical protein
MFKVLGTYPVQVTKQRRNEDNRQARLILMPELRGEGLMEYEVTCRCGKVIRVSQGMAGSSRSCDCGTTVLVPPPCEYPAPASTDATPPPVPDIRPPDKLTPEPRSRPEINTPTPISLRIGRGARAERRAAVMAALTPESLWISGCLAATIADAEGSRDRKTVRRQGDGADPGRRALS